MPKLKAVRVSLNRSIKVAEYKYYKVGFEVEVEVEDGDTDYGVIQSAKELCNLEVQKLIEEEKRRYVTNESIQKYKNMMKQYPENSAEYELAKEKLATIEAELIRK